MEVQDGAAIKDGNTILESLDENHNQTHNLHKHLLELVYYFQSHTVFQR